MGVTSRPNSPKRLFFIVCTIVAPVILLMGLNRAIRAKPQEASAPICQQAKNSVPNPGFEQGIAVSWVESGLECTFSDSSAAYQGDKAAEIYAAGKTRYKCMLSTTPIHQIAVQPGTFYDYSTWTRVDPGGTAYLSVTFWRLDLDLEPQEVGEPVQTPVVTDTQGSWVQVVGSFQAPADAEYAQVEATLAEESLGSVWFDEVYLGLATCLDLVKHDNPDDVKPGGLLTYTIVYSNTGREAATGVRITETYDYYVHYLWAEPPPAPGNGDNLWEVAELPAGETGVITIVVQVDLDSIERNKLVNQVVINADEIQSPITDLVFTNIITEGVCAVDLLAKPESQTAKPGQTANYELEFLNVGLYDGQVVLTATSELGLDLEFDLLTHTLPVAGAASAILGLHVPSTLPFPSFDTTWITATIECRNELMGDQGGSVSTTIVDYKVALPLTMKDYVDCRTDPWESEPNDSCSGNEASGPLCLGQEYYGYPDDAWDWFWVNSPDEGLVLELTSGSGTIGPGEGIQLVLCDQTCESAGCIWDNIPEDGYRIEAPGISGPYYIGIFFNPESGFSTDWTYTLKVTPW